MAKPKKTAKKPARKPTRKAPQEVKLAPEKLEKLHQEFAAQGVASVEIPSSPQGFLKVQRS